MVHVHTTHIEDCLNACAFMSFGFGCRAVVFGPGMLCLGNGHPLHQNCRYSPVVFVWLIVVFVLSDLFNNSINLVVCIILMQRPGLLASILKRKPKPIALTNCSFFLPKLVLTDWEPVLAG